MRELNWGRSCRAIKMYKGKRCSLRSSPPSLRRNGFLSRHRFETSAHINQQTAVDPLNQPIQYMDAQPRPPKKKRNCSIFEDISCILSVLCDSKPKTGCPFTSEFFFWCVKIQELNKMAIFTTTTAFDSMLKWHGYIGWSYEVDYTGRTTRKQTCGHGMQQNRWTISISFPFPCCSRHCTWAGLRDVVG